jgi:lambda family phage tail tape measure protein
MANQVVFKVSLDGGKQVVEILNQVESGVKRATKAGDGGAPGVRTMERDVGSLATQMRAAGASTQSLVNTLRHVAGLYGLTQIASSLGRAMLDAQVSAQKLQATLTYIAGGAGGAAKELEYLRKTADKLGLDFTSASTAYAKFSAATKESGISGEVTRQTFEGIAKAASHMGLSADETNGALLALSQIASKGVVSAEELRGQLGERLPGAFSLAAKAMGVTEKALGDMLQKGELVASDFLPRFARELNNSFAQPVNNVVSELNRLSSAFDLFKQSLFSGNAGGLFGPITDGLNESSAAMRALGFEAGLTHRLLVALGGAIAGAAGSNRFNVGGRQKDIMENELPDVKRQLAALDARREGGSRFGMAEGKAYEFLQARAKALRVELEKLAKAQGDASGWKKTDIDLKGQFESQQAAQQKAATERLRGYLGDTGNESRAVKIAADVEKETFAFKNATTGLKESSKEYISALEAHQRRVAEIQAKGAPRGRSGGRAIDPEREREKMLREQQRMADQEAREIEQANRHRIAQERAAAVMARTVGNLDDAYQRQNAIYDESQMSAPQRELAEALRRVEEAADAAREALAAKAATLNVDDVEALNAYRAAVERVTSAEAAQLDQVKALQTEQERLNGLWETGAQRALTAYMDSGLSVADQTEAAFTRAFGNMEDALMGFLETGKLNFADFAKSLIADMARIELRALLSKQIGGGDSGGGGGFGGIIGSLVSGVSGFFGGGSGGALAGSLGAAGGLPLPSFDTGIDYVPFDMVAKIHRGERVMTAAENSGGGGGTTIINNNFYGISNAGELRRAGGQLSRQVAGAVDRSRRFQ